jgi:UDP-3-O-[3-hydroxymyristoyl] glucosamine N-acyltransferase
LKRFTLKELAAQLGGAVDGDPGREVTGVAALDDAGEEHISFLANPRYRGMLEGSRAGAVIVAEDLEVSGRDLIRVSDPYLAFAEVMFIFHGERHPPEGVSELASIHPEATVGTDVTIEPFVVISQGAAVGDRVHIMSGTHVGRDASVGDDTVIHPNVTLEHGTVVGRRCIIHAACVLGSDGYGFAADGLRHRKIIQAGIVRVGDDVEMGSGCTIDRAALGETVIGEGTKMDNQVHVAHNVVVGRNCLLINNCGIAGSSTLGDNVIMAGHSGVSGHLNVGDGAILMTKAVAVKDVPAGAVMAGVPAIDATTWKRSSAVFARLDGLKKQVARLEKKLKELAEEGEESD